jgi:hypothetical protein
MRGLKDLLREALGIGDTNGVTQIRRRHLPGGVMTELVRQTHEHAASQPGGPARSLTRRCTRKPEQ